MPLLMPHTRRIWPAGQSAPRPRSANLGSSAHEFQGTVEDGWVRADHPSLRSAGAEPGAVSPGTRDRSVATNRPAGRSRPGVAAERGGASRLRAGIPEPQQPRFHGGSVDGDFGGIARSVAGGAFPAHSAPGWSDFKIAGEPDSDARCSYPRTSMPDWSCSPQGMQESTHWRNPNPDSRTCVKTRSSHSQAFVRASEGPMHPPSKDCQQIAALESREDDI